VRMTKYYLPTLKETPTEAEIVSHQLMLRAGLMRTLTAGIYSFLPLGYRVIRKIEEIVREAMNEGGAQEILMPVIHDARLWKESDRWDRFGPLMIKLEDRKGREYCLGPTHEEVITDMIRDEVRSYKDLPFNLYQVQTKVRDEIRPRFGVIRAREFIMKDAYTFDRDFEGLDDSYQTMYEAYTKAFFRCGLKVRAVEADTGPMGGKDSHEFMVLADAGEDEIAFCDKCNYAANVERAVSRNEEIPAEQNDEELKTVEKVHTPQKKSIEEISEFFNVKPEKTIKALGMIADDEPVLVLLRGDDELNEVKLQNYLEANEVETAAEEKFPKFFDSVAGFLGPVNIKKGIKIIADKRIKQLKNSISGANEEDYHLRNVNPGRDFRVDKYLDLRNVKSGEGCPRCDGYLKIKSGIEVGHIFKLGTKYSESMGAKYLDENGREQLIVMGSYGIGITRLVAAAIEQNNDEQGIIWPKAIAPFEVIIVMLGRDKKVAKEAEDLYQQLKSSGIDVLFDDRNERAGVKFNDADLIGIPLRLTVGSRSLEKGVIETKIRRTGEERELSLGDAVKQIKRILEKIE